VKTPLPLDEAARLDALRRYDVLDSPREAAFERIATMAARVFDVPTVLISLVDEDRQWLKSAYGCDLSETARDIAFCAHAILQDEVMVVPDASLDARFVDNPLVTGAPFVRFYAGAPLQTSEGFKLGTLCLLDTRPRELTPNERATLSDLAAVVVDELELRIAMKQSQLENRERRRAEEEVRQSEAHFRSLIENAMDIITILDPDGVILYESPALERIFDYAPDELIGRNAFEFVHPDDAPALLENFGRRVRGEGDSVSTGGAVEFRFLHKDGSWRTLEAAGSFPVSGPDARGIVVNSRDITERKRAEEALHESEARKAAILESALDCIVSIDHQGIITEFNPAAERTFGYTNEEACGRELADLIIPPQFRDLYRGGTDNFLSTGEWPALNRRLELPAQRSDGAAISIEMAVTRIAVDGPAVFAAHIRDISERAL